MDGVAQILRSLTCIVYRSAKPYSMGIDSEGLEHTGRSEKIGERGKLLSTDLLL